MSASKYRPHVLILPEDDANGQLATGFSLHESIDLRAIQILPEAGGWLKVRALFSEVHIAEMLRNPLRNMVLLVDFDGEPDRLDSMKKVIPDSLIERVFILGVWLEPEDFPKRLGSLEQIGKQLASECQDNTRNVWNHELLQHNSNELDRMNATIKPILFPST